MSLMFCCGSGVLFLLLGKGQVCFPSLSARPLISSRWFLCNLSFDRFQGLERFKILCRTRCVLTHKRAHTHTHAHADICRMLMNQVPHRVDLSHVSSGSPARSFVCQCISQDVLQVSSIAFSSICL